MLCGLCSLPGFKLSHEGADKTMGETVQRSNKLRPQAPAAVKQVFLFEVKEDLVGRVKECALTDLRRPLVSEYDFRRHQNSPSLEIALKPTTKIRYYQVLDKRCFLDVYGSLLFLVKLFFLRCVALQCHFRSALCVKCFQMGVPDRGLLCFLVVLGKR